MKQKNKVLFMIFPVFALALMPGISGCKAAGAGSAESELVLGTLCTIDLFENGNPELYSRLFTRLAELDRLLSANRDDSELAVVNRNAGLEAIRVSPDLYTVLERARYFAEASGGAFDPTVGPLVKLWDIGAKTPRIPEGEEIRAALDLVNWRDLELTADAAGGGTAFLKRQGMALDLGAIAKGYAADELVRILREAEIPRALIDLGGNIYVWGNKAGGAPWRVGVQDPVHKRGTHAGILEPGNNVSVVSSGIYERYFTGNDGRHYHHIFGLTEAVPENRRGYPVENGILSTTVIAVSSMDADALSTSCFVLGYEKGLALAEVNGAEVLFIFEDKSIHLSRGALAAFTVTGDYRIE